MAKRKSDSEQHNLASSPLPKDFKPHWRTALENTTQRFEREYRQENFSLPSEVQALSLFDQWQGGTLQNLIVSPFWEVKTPKKKQAWLDIGCGLSFLIYPWYEWNAFFYGQEVSTTARDILMSRAPQLNSKLFRGVKLGSPHLLAYEDNLFDGAIATGWSCYYPLDYWERVLAEVKRVLKPGGYLIFDVLDPEAPLAEDWAILETYLGAEVFLTSLSDWRSCVRQAEGKITKSSPGELFHCWLVRF
ncbi:Methylase involved in ubiquinone/menaquinone biosynthesis [Hyella patelloides LEGE 07179]|uniref:Methylase involved in ubiquinone/menaquinone biosynthesis n=1 Tax=Hyella patelloides LEGE 07179 TaxID=945734 RepID=A0A563VIZ8_9CYAN|nr:class I SAM-dependent methyltransferase [Hyella patelloides]VEP11379.1 Methylase involved in ubiquinone/menaquinone biosynthesis [Hyella patelloides LEGE 07179]